MLFRSERFVEATVRSVLDQTHRDLELVVIEDGSTDGTRAILRGVAASDPRLRVVEKENEGLIATLNRGFNRMITNLRQVEHDRALLLAGLAHGTSRLTGALKSQDTSLMAGALLGSVPVAVIYSFFS